MRIIVAPEDNDNFERPSIFLGGAITGAPNWQPEAAKLLSAGFKTCFNPRRETPFVAADHPDFMLFYREQVEWEHKHLLAADVVLFWMPKEAIAITTRFEVGWWYGLQFDKSAQRHPFVVGIEPGTLGDTYYRVVLPDIGVKVHNTLAATCQAALNLLNTI